MGGGWEREDTEGGYEREQWCVTGVGTMDESGKLSWHYCYCYYLWTRDGWARDGSDICKLYHTNKQKKHTPSTISPHPPIPPQNCPWSWKMNGCIHSV